MAYERFTSSGSKIRCFSFFSLPLISMIETLPVDRHLLGTLFLEDWPKAWTLVMSTLSYRSVQMSCVAIFLSVASGRLVQLSFPPVCFPDFDLTLPCQRTTSLWCYCIFVRKLVTLTMRRARSYRWVHFVTEAGFTKGAAGNRGTKSRKLCTRAKKEKAKGIWRSFSNQLLVVEKSWLSQSVGLFLLVSLPPTFKHAVSR